MDIKQKSEKTVSAYPADKNSAFLKEVPILLLDEITSNVDPVNEALIQEVISELAKDRTVIVVAHHLSTIRSADQILVFRNGNIVESGKHIELLDNQNGYYHTLWNQNSYEKFTDANVSNIEV